VLTRYTRLVRPDSPAAYGIAVGLIGAAGLIRLALNPVLGAGTPFITLFPAVLMAGVIGGARAAVVSLALATAFAWAVYLDPIGSFALPRAADLLGLGLFVAGSSLMIVASETVRGAAARADLERHRLAAALDASRTGTWRWDIARDEVEWDDAMCAVYGLPRDLAPRTSGEFFALVHPDDRAHASAAVTGAVNRGQPAEYEFRTMLPDGRVRWIYDRSRVARGPDGRPDYMIGACLDVTARKEADERLRLHSMLLEAMSEGVSLSREDGTIVYVNPAEERLFGYGPGELIGQHVTVQNAYPPQENAERVAEVIAALKEHGHWEGEWRNRRKDGTEFVSAASIMAVQVAGRPHWLCVQRDVTERKRAEERQQLLINELNHRVKNTLATVQSLASQSSRGAGSLAEFRDAFVGRLLALSATHDLLTQELWESASLRRVLLAELRPFTRDGQVEIRGEDVELKPQQAVSLGLALHELATNAAKYGGLSSPDGRLDVAWDIDGGAGRLLRIRWDERSAAPVAPPAHRGFGSQLIERLVRHELGGTLHMDFAPTGLRCAIEVPLGEAGEAAATPEQATVPAGAN
jgi:PAS domain S-box-containing protein